MNALDTYTTITKGVRRDTRMLGSRFIGTTAPASTPAAAEAVIAAVRREFHDATHHAFALRCGAGPECIERMSDAGEPSGTAGWPIAVAIETAGLTYLVVVVSRYFGGKKLSKGRLARAYGECAAATLAAATRAVAVLSAPVAIAYPYTQAGVVERLLQEYEVTVELAEYEGAVALTVQVPRSMVEEFQAKFMDVTAGKGRVTS